MLGVIVRIDGWDPIAGAAVTLRAASHDDQALCHLDGATWWPAIATLPKLRYDLFDGAFTAAITSPSSSLTLGIEPWPLFARYALANARIRISTGEIGTPIAAWTQRFDGRITEQPAIAAGRAEINFAVDDRWLDTSILTTYAGTTGAEGPAGLKGQAKPLALGAPRYVAGVLIDSVNSVFQISAYGPIQAFEAALERLLRYGAPVADYPTYAALVAAAIPPGRWATAKAVGMARFGAPPTGQVSFLVQGDNGSAGGWIRKPGQLIRRLALLAGGAGRIDDASLDALDVARPYSLSIYLDQQTSARELIQRIAASVNAVAGVSWNGQLFVHPFAIGSGALTLAADGTALPPVADVKQLAVPAPYTKLAITAERAWTVHALSDIAFTAELIDMGAYVAGTTYREGNIVQYQGSSWIYRNPAPSAGNAPPALPIEQDSYWTVLAKAGATGPKGDPGQLNMLDMSSWVPGATGTVGRFLQNGESVENSIVTTTGPTGASEPVWRGVSKDARFTSQGASSEGDGGWIYSLGTTEFDPRKSYRFMCWMLQGADKSGDLYLGTGGDAPLVMLDGVGQGDASNPYFWVGDLPTDKWMLVVGIVHGAGYTGGQSGISGVYDPSTGKRVQVGYDWKMPANLTVLRHRVYQFYAALNSDSYFARPTLEEVGETTFSIEQLFGTVGMTAQQAQDFAAAQERITAIGSDGVISAGAEKQALVGDAQRLNSLTDNAISESLAINANYGFDATQGQRQAVYAARDALNSFLSTLAPAWNAVTADTPVDGTALRTRFGNAYSAAQTLGTANSAYVRARTKAALDLVTAMSSDSVLSAGSEKQKAIIEWQAVYNEYYALDTRANALGRPADIEPALQAAFTACVSGTSSLSYYLSNLSPSWNDTGLDTPIVAATWVAKWNEAYAKLATLSAAITGRKGDAGASSFTLKNINNIQATPNSVTKYVGGNNWDGKAQTIESATAATVSGLLPIDAFVGLTFDPAANTSFDSIDYGIHFSSNGTVYRYRNGAAEPMVVRGAGAGPVRASVRCDGKTVSYLAEGYDFSAYNHPVDSPGVPLYGVFSIFSVGTKIDQITFARDGVQGAGATNLVAMSATTLISGNNVRGTANTGWGTDAAYSRETYTGGAVCTFTAPAEHGENFMAGLTQGAGGDRGKSYDGITFALFREGGTGATSAYINGGGVGPAGPIVKGPLRGRVHFDGRYVRWYANDTLVHTFDWLGTNTALGYLPENSLRFACALASNDPRVENISLVAAGAKGGDGRDGTNGTNGLNGTNGQSIHIAYSDAADGSVNFTTGDAAGRTFIGVYTDTNPGADSTNPASYGWTRLRGLDGTNGINGPGGYVHIAYANSANGTVDFHLSDPTGRAYIGTYTDQTEPDSGNPATYAWQLVKGADGKDGINGTNGASADQLGLGVLANGSLGMSIPSSGSTTFTDFSQTINVVAGRQFKLTMVALNGFRNTGGSVAVATIRVILGSQVLFNGTISVDVDGSIFSSSLEDASTKLIANNVSGSVQLVVNHSRGGPVGNSADFDFNFILERV